MASASIPDHLLREVQLATNADERDKYDSLADIFAILRTLEFLERAYIRDSIGRDDYQRECDRLLSSFKLAKNLVGEAFDIDVFMKDYGLNCPSATNRIKAGVNQVTLDGDGSQTNNKAKDAAECTGQIIGLSDALELDANTKEDIQPYLVQILHILQRFKDLPSDFAGKETMQKWIKLLGPMGAADEVNESQLADLRFDIDSLRTAFTNAL